MTKILFAASVASKKKLTNTTEHETKDKETHPSENKDRRCHPPILQIPKWQLQSLDQNTARLKDTGRSDGEILCDIGGVRAVNKTERP